MYGSVVFDLPKKPFEQLLEDAPARAAGVERDIDLPVDGAAGDRPRVQGPRPAARPAATSPTTRCEQLWGAIAAVFESWNTRRAIDYRKLHDIPDTMGTAVNVVAMVFGNLGEDSGTGVAFTRDPSTGERTLYGEYLLNAQGEDVVSGSRTPLPIAHAQGPAARTPTRSSSGSPRTLERHFRDVQDMEFTIERGTLYMLQTRRGQRIGPRRGAHRLRDGGRGADHARRRPSPGSRPTISTSCCIPTIDPGSQLDLLTTGLPASPGAACGTVVFDADRAEQLGAPGSR